MKENKSLQKFYNGWIFYFTFFKKIFEMEFDRKKNLSEKIWIIIVLEEFWAKITPEEKAD